eukprot:scaffold8828_cov204-Amphora_coffeaeformis.AAC.20
MNTHIASKSDYEECVAQGRRRLCVATGPNDDLAKHLSTRQAIDVRVSHCGVDVGIYLSSSKWVRKNTSNSMKE